MLKRLLPILLLTICALSVLSVPAFAEELRAGWEITSHSGPTDMQPGKRSVIELYVFNVGGASSEADKPITVTDVLPEGVTAIYAGDEVHGEEGQAWDCTGSSLVRCTNDPANLGTFPGGDFPLAAGVTGHVTPPIVIEVTVSGAPRTGTNHASVAGGGALEAASTSSPLHISSGTAPFGVANWDVWFSNANGTLDTQAGSHPYSATFDLEVNSEAGERYRYVESTGGPLAGAVDFASAGGELRNATVELPPGFVGNPTAVPQCPRKTFDEVGNTQKLVCSPNTVIGFATTDSGIGLKTEAIYNLVPPHGLAAQFGFDELGNPVFLDSSVRTGGDSGITSHADNTPQGRLVLGAVVTLWGVPGDPSHDPSRCIFEAQVRACSSGAGTAPLLTLPTECGSQPTVRVRVNEWQDANVTGEKTVALHDSNDAPAGFTGCEKLSFGPTITAAPDTHDTDTPAGLTVEVRPPIGGLSLQSGLSTADIQNTRVTLPEGVVINPGQAAGLQACKQGDVPGGDDLPLPGENGEEERFAGPQDCPSASKVGTVTIQTPLLEGDSEKQLEGNVYVLESEPPELKLLVAASADGVNAKLVGTVHINEQNGRLETTFNGTPELPFTNFKLSFSGGSQAALDTPTQCGTYTTNAVFTSWSSPFIPDFASESSFAITNGTNGAPCPTSPLPFSPSLTAGATTDQAGGFTDFSLLLQRGDGQQRIDGLRFKAPEGLTGFLSHVPLCTNAQAEANACPAASKIGHTVVEAGPGPYPLVVPEPGQEPAPIYLTESYGGAPFGLAIVVPLHVGPFVLPTQRVRARIEVDPHTSALMITTDPLPQVVAGVPTDLREIDAVIERPEFMVNPTNCSPQEFSGTAYGTPPPGQGGAGVSAAISSHFQVGACRSLEFTPKLSASASGKTSKANGASLTYKVSYPNVPQGTQSDIQYVKVELPGELPSRLTTLQKACAQSAFRANPASCPAASVIGHAMVHTALLPVPLEGPVYFVSNGGEAFPNLVMVLQGDGVTVELVGDTLIKNGVTSTTFKTVPDDPFSTFEINLPEGPYSALAANSNLCKPTVAKTVRKKVKVKVHGHTETVTRKVKKQVSTPLTIPSDYVGQNGASYKANVPVTVTGCAKAKPAKKTKAKKTKAKKKTKGKKKTTKK